MADSFPELEDAGGPALGDRHGGALPEGSPPTGSLHRTVEYSLTGLWTTQSMGEVSGGGGLP